MKKNQAVVVDDHAPHHAGRKGYFAFYGEGPSESTSVLSAEPILQEGSTTYFAVANDHVCEVR